MKSINSITTSFNTQQDLSPLSIYENYQLPSSNVRIICKRILYLIGIPYEIANEETLIKKEYLGQYGSIHKIIVNKNGYMKNESNSPTYSCYITYSNELEASLALLSLNNSTLFNHKLNACYGTNKYCNSFIKGIECNNKDCFYLHELANKNDIISKNDTQMKIQFIEQQKIATKIADIFSPKQKRIYINKGLKIKKEFVDAKIDKYFPTIDTIYNKKFIQELENETENNNNISLNKNNKDYYYKSSSPNNSYSKKNIKNNGFSSPDLQKLSNDKLIEDEGDNEEYILVRQPSRQKKKYGNNRNQYKKNYYKKNNCKLKFTLEKYKLKYNINQKQIIPSSPLKYNNYNLLNELAGDNDINEKSKIMNCVNTININSQTNSGYNTNESSSQNNPQEEIDLKKNIFKNYKKSRFSFVNDNNMVNFEQKRNFKVPDFINVILNKKLYSLYFSNYISKKRDVFIDNTFLEKILLDEEAKIVNNWAFTN